MIHPINPVDVISLLHVLIIINFTYISMYIYIILCKFMVQHYSIKFS